MANYQRSWLSRDLTSGISVAAIALPVGIAYAVLAGVSPVVGIYSAIFPLFAYAIFGSSRQLMIGPDAATCIIVAASLAPLAGGDPVVYTTLLFWLTLMTGVIYLLAGIGKLGFIADFFSQPILTGYLNGIALLIIVGQIPQLLGYQSREDEFFNRILELITHVNQSHWQTAALGISMLILILLIRRFFPLLPSAFIVVVIGIALVAGLDLDKAGVSILGEVPSGLPTIIFPSFKYDIFDDLFTAASGIMLVSFTSGVLTSKSFAQRNGYEVDANHELIGFGAGNIASSLAQGFPVTGADSRTAVNSAMGGKTQLAGVFAGVTMLAVLLFLTSPLTYVPKSALAAVILVSAVSLFDLADLRKIFDMNRREFLLSVTTTLGVLVLGVLPGVFLAIILSLVWLLKVQSRPNDAILGRVDAKKGFHSMTDYPEGKTIPGLLIYRFESNIVFYNVGYFKKRILAAIADQPTPVKWVVVDASPVNVIDVTALREISNLRKSLAAKNISMYSAHVKKDLSRFFSPEFVEERGSKSFPTLKRAVKAYCTNPNN